MKKFLIRNDDVAFDTELDEIRTFCDICDKHDFKIIQAITVVGPCKTIDVRMDNREIINLGKRKFMHNFEVCEYLKGRDDIIGVHGLWHSHVPDMDEIVAAKWGLVQLGFNPTYFIPPFNEGDYPSEVAGMKLSKLSMRNGERLEDFLKKGTPTKEIMYLHSWRFDNKFYTFEVLDKCLERLSKEYDQ